MSKNETGKASGRPSDKAEAIRIARRLELETGERHYAVRAHDGTWDVTARMPLLGESYDSEGIAHGR